MSTPIIDNAFALLQRANTFTKDQIVKGNVYFGVNGTSSISADASGHTYVTLPNSSVNFQTTHGAALGIRVSSASGTVIGNSTGSYPGSNQINTEGYKFNGVALPFQEGFESSEQTITSAGTLTLAHGLSNTPTVFNPLIICKTAELGYAIGEKLPIGGFNTYSGNYGSTMWADATNIYVQFGKNSDVFYILGRGAAAGGSYPITPASWKFIMEAYA